MILSKYAQQYDCNIIESYITIHINHLTIKKYVANTKFW